MKHLKRWLPLLIVIALLILIISTGWYHYLSFSSLQQHRALISQWVSQHYGLCVVGFMLTYIIAAAASIPGAVFLTLAGGFMFGPWFGTVYVVTSATIGACCAFLAVRTALGEWLASKAQGWIAKLEKGFQQNAFSYVLSLRLIPIFPFWVINIAAALLNVELKQFFLATLIGIIPGSFVYNLVGNGLGELFAAGKTPDLTIIFTPNILIPLLLLAALSLLPTVYKKITKKPTND